MFERMIHGLNFYVYVNSIVIINALTCLGHHDWL